MSLIHMVIVQFMFVKQVSLVIFYTVLWETVQFYISCMSLSQSYVIFDPC